MRCISRLYAAAAAARSATMILKHYLAAHPEMADTAIGKLIAFHDGDGEAEFGI